MRNGLVCLGLLLAACSTGERDDAASTIFGSSTNATLSGGMSTESSASGVDADTSTNTDNDSVDDDGATEDPTGDGDSTADTADTADTNDSADTADTPDTADTADTNDPLCGNGQIDQGEECDGQNLAGESCVDHGFDGGVLACDPTICIFDTSGCMDEPSNECDSNCNGCACPSFECTMCCALKDKVDACGGGMCGCF